MRHTGNLKAPRDACLSSSRLSASLIALIVAVSGALSCFSLTGCSILACTFPVTPPALAVSTGQQQSTAVLNAYTWPSSGSGSTEPLKIQESLDPALPSYPLFLMPGDSITFLLQGLSLKPESANVEVCGIVYPGTMPEQANHPESSTLKDFTVDRQGVSWSWTVPLVEPVPQVNTSRTLRIEVTWTKPEPATAVYFVSFCYAEVASIKEASAEALAHFERQYDGSQGSMLALFPLTFPPEYQDLSVYAFELVSEPKTQAKTFDAVYPEDYLYAEVHVAYSLKSTHKHTGANVVWELLDRCGLKHEDGKWSVIWAIKAAMPWAFDGDKEPGWEVTLEQSSLPDDDGTMVKVGPFTRISTGSSSLLASSGEFLSSTFGGNIDSSSDTSFGDSFNNLAFSDDGRYLAFAADNFGRQEIWILSRDGSNLKRVLSIPSASIERRSGSQNRLRIIGWAPLHLSPEDTSPATETKPEEKPGHDSSQYKIRFCFQGYQTTGPYQAGSGCWLAEVDCVSEDVRDIAFLAGSGDGEVVMSADRNNIVFSQSEGWHRFELWKVVLDTGQAKFLGYSDLSTWPEVLGLAANFLDRYQPALNIPENGEIQPDAANSTILPGIQVFMTYEPWSEVGPVPKVHLSDKCHLHVVIPDYAVLE